MSTGMMSPPNQQQMSAVVAPSPTETQSQFYERAWPLLKSQFPETNQRTIAILKIWYNSPNNAILRRKAEAKFPASSFTHNGPRCEFLSHTIPPLEEEQDETGNVTRAAREESVYDKANLQKLVDYANYRIQNSDIFAALSKGHMPSQSEKASGTPDADTLGYSGPFYLALFGDLNPQWSIWADEWVHNEDWPVAKRLQRRSPEVWHRQPMERRTMDPIAMLGSETPRLDTGMNFYALRAADGQEVMRYSLGTAEMNVSLPGPGNTYVPGSETGKHKYGANPMADMPPNGQQAPPKAPPQSPPPGGDKAAPDAGQMDPAMMDAVAQALAQVLPQICQIVKQSMGAADGSDPDGIPPENVDEDNASTGNDVPRGIEPASPPAASATPNAVDQNAAMPQVQPQQAQPAPSYVDGSHAKYAAMSPDCGAAYAAGHAAGCQKGKPPMTAGTTNYSLQFEEHVKPFKEQIAAQAKRIAFLEQKDRDIELYSRIREISLAHDIGDVQEHVTSLAEAGEDEIERYCKVLERLPAKGDITGVQLYDDPKLNPEGETTNYSARGGKRLATQEEVTKYSRQAQDVCVHKREKGEQFDFDAEFEVIMKSKGFDANGMPL